MICTFECTYCAGCVAQILHNVCPNCGGGFEKRPTRPAGSLVKFPAQTESLVRAVAVDRFTELLEKFQHIEPRKR